MATRTAATARASHHGAKGYTIGRPLAGLADLAIRIYRRRKAVHDLQRLDERMLRDVGLTRADVTRASQMPAWDDPTPMLNAARRNAKRR